MIDTHAHIDAEEFDADRTEVIYRSFDEGIEAMIIPAVEPGRFDSTLSATRIYDNIYAAIGIHPHNSANVSEQDFKKIYEYSNKEKVVAIGEIGLDYYYDFSPIDAQTKVFRRQLQIAKELNLPVIIHNRSSENDLLRIYEDEQDGTLRGVLHCFYGNKEYLAHALNLGLYVSFTGNVTFKKFDSHEALLNVPNDRFMLETDSPYMTPVPYRGKRNEPKFVKYVAEKVAELKSLTIHEVIDMTTKNAKKFFNLSLIVIILISTSMALSFAQNLDHDENDEDAPRHAYREKPYNHFKKTLGIGFTLGTNTIVESYKPDPQDVSYEGLIAIGGTIQASPFDFLVLSATYLYAKNDKLVEKFPDIKENIHQQIEFTAHFLINPRNKINFYGMVGPSILLNQYGLSGGEVDNSNKIGINAGLGFFINLPVGGAGLFAIQAEWKLDFMLGKTDRNFDPRFNQGHPNFDRDTETKTFFSIPRLNIMWYPPFFSL